MTVDLLLGLQWGEAEKVKLLTFLSKYAIVCFQGGPNAAANFLRI
jgi:adenylosuccinate synthase